MPDIKQIKAWDGYASYWHGIEGSTEYRDLWELLFTDSPYDEWSLKKNGKIRQATGLIIYERDSNGNIVYTPNIKYLRSKLGTLHIKRVTEVIQ